MKKKILFVYGLIHCTVLISACSVNSTSTEIVDPNYVLDSTESSFSSNDISTFTFEGTEYSFPLAYDILTKLGWRISDYSYQLLDQEDLETSFLQLENESYPNVIMDIEVFNWLDDQRAWGSVEELVCEFEKDGVWGIAIYPDTNATSEIVFPNLSFKGVTFGSTPDDIINSFGADLYPTSDVENGSYDYFSMESGFCYSLYFDVNSNGVYGISASFSS